MNRTVQQAQADAVKAAREALAVAGIAHDEVGANVTVTAPEGTGAALVVVTIGDETTDRVWHALSWGATLECERSLREPWRIAVWTREPEPDTVPQTIGVEFSREVAADAAIALRYAGHRHPTSGPGLLAAAARLDRAVVEFDTRVATEVGS